MGACRWRVDVPGVEVLLRLPAPLFPGLVLCGVRAREEGAEAASKNTLLPKDWRRSLSKLMRREYPDWAVVKLSEEIAVAFELRN